MQYPQCYWLLLRRYPVQTSIRIPATNGVFLVILSYGKQVPEFFSRCGHMWLRPNHLQLSAHLSTENAVITKQNSATNTIMQDTSTQPSSVIRNVLYFVGHQHEYCGVIRHVRIDKERRNKYRRRTNYFFLNNQKDALIIQIYSVIKL